MARRSAFAAGWKPVNVAMFRSSSRVRIIAETSSRCPGWAMARNGLGERSPGAGGVPLAAADDVEEAGQLLVRGVGQERHLQPFTLKGVRDHHRLAPRHG